MKTAIVGGGAAGFFLAVNLKEMMPTMDVAILERSSRVLAKVEVSGGGRCNCTNTFDGVADLRSVYPRGHRLMKRLMNVFSQKDACQWFERHGVRLTVQADDCVFPASQDAHTIVDCLTGLAARHGVEVRKNSLVTSLDDLSDYDFVAVATGGSPRPEGLRWLADKGIATVDPVPSLFTLAIDDEQLHSLMGTVADEATLLVPGTPLRASGPLLITHWGLSGPAALKLSSHGARYMHQQDYRMPLAINWTSHADDEVMKELHHIAATHPNRQVATQRPFGLSTRLWACLADKAIGQRATAPWQSLNRKEYNRMVSVLTTDGYLMSGRAPFKDEFVTCGGVSLDAVNLATLESKVVPRLYFAGEVLDVDGVTGGFNFQAAWTTAYTVAQAIVGSAAKGQRS